MVEIQVLLLGQVELMGIREIRETASTRAPSIIPLQEAMVALVVRVEMLGIWVRLERKVIKA